MENKIQIVGYYKWNDEIKLRILRRHIKCAGSLASELYKIEIAETFVLEKKILAAQIGTSAKAQQRRRM